MHRVSITQKLLGYAPPPPSPFLNRVRVEPGYKPAQLQDDVPEHIQPTGCLAHTMPFQTHIYQPVIAPASPTPVAQPRQSPTPAQFITGLVCYNSAYLSQPPSPSPDAASKGSTATQSTILTRTSANNNNNNPHSSTHNHAYIQTIRTHSSITLPYSTSGLAPVLICSLEPRAPRIPLPRSPSPDHLTLLPPRPPSSRKRSSCSSNLTQSSVPTTPTHLPDHSLSISTPKSFLESMVMRGASIQVPVPPSSLSPSPDVMHSQSSSLTPISAHVCPASPQQPHPTTPISPQSPPHIPWGIIGQPLAPPEPPHHLALSPHQPTSHHRDPPRGDNHPVTDADALLAKVQLAESKVHQLIKSDQLTEGSKVDPTVERRRRRPSGGALVLVQYQGPEMDIGPITISTALRDRKSSSLNLRSSMELAGPVQGTGPTSLDMCAGVPHSSKGSGSTSSSSSNSKLPHPGHRLGGPSSTWTPLLRPLLPTAKQDTANCSLELQTTTIPSLAAFQSASGAYLYPAGVPASNAIPATSPGVSAAPPFTASGALSPDVAGSGRLFRGSIAAGLMQSRRAFQTTNRNSSTNTTVPQPGLVCRTFNGPVSSVNLTGSPGSGSHAIMMSDSRCFLPALTLAELARLET